jgi:hypothetical protein
VLFRSVLALTLGGGVCSAGDDDRPHAGKDPFQQFDRNEDGKISVGEFPGTSARFAELDRDGDGFLSRDELRADTPMALPSFGGAHEGPSGGGHGAGRSGPGGFEKDDSNGDGKVSRDEFTGPADLFAKLDSNGDGYITKDEIKNQGPPNGPPPDNGSMGPGAGN